MIDPYKRCPRCDVEYISGDRNIDTYYHVVCGVCSLRCYRDTSTHLKFQIGFCGRDDDKLYLISWLDDGSSAVCIDPICGGMGDTMFFRFDHWIPFDIDIEGDVGAGVLRMWLTFQ